MGIGPNHTFFQRKHDQNTKMCSTSLGAMQMQIKTTLSYYLLECLYQKDKRCQGHREKETFVYWGEYKLLKPLWKVVWKMLKKLKIQLLNFTSGYISKKMKSECQRELCPCMSIATSFTITKIWKKPKCPPTDEWMCKIHVYFFEFSFIQGE